MKLNTALETARGGQKRADISALFFVFQLISVFADPIPNGVYPYFHFRVLIFDGIIKQSY
jgi:hypothetical protein